MIFQWFSKRPEAYVMDLFERYGSGEARVANLLVGQRWEV